MVASSPPGLACNAMSNQGKPQAAIYRGMILKNRSRPTAISADGPDVLLQVLARQVVQRVDSQRQAQQTRYHEARIRAGSQCRRKA